MDKEMVAEMFVNRGILKWIGKWQQKCLLAEVY